MMGGFLDYVPGESVLHKVNPLTKIFAAFMLCISCFISVNHFFILGIIIFNLFLSASAGVFKRSIGMLKALIKLSIFIFVIQILFVSDGNVIFRLPLNIVITDLGFLFSLLFVLRLFAATMPLALMLSVTQMSDLSNVLVERLGVPFKYTFALTTAIRFIPLFSQEMSGVMEAQISRGVEFDTKNFFKKIRLLLPLCVPLLISSVRKIDSASISAELRGFNLRQKGNGYRDYGFGILDFTGVLLIVIIMFISFIV